MEEAPGQAAGAVQVCTLVEIAACPICQGPPAASPHYDRPFQDPEVAGFLARYYQGRLDPRILGDARFRIERCPRCDFYWQRHVFDEATSETFYGVWIDPEASREKHLSRPIAQRAEQFLMAARHLRKLASAGRGLRALDFGGGWGEWATYAMALGADAYMVESEPNRLAHAGRRGVTAASSIEALGVAQFDLINLNQVLEHIPEPAKLLAYLAGFLRPGGLIHIAVPQAAPDAPVLAKGPFQPLEHVNGFTTQALRALLARVDLAIERDYVAQAALGVRGVAQALSRNAALRLAPAARLPLKTTVLARKPGPR